MHLLGPPMILLFCVSQALRDVYLGNVFQGTGVFAVVLLAFSISTLFFGSIAVWRRPGELAALRQHPRDAALMILTTALAWPCYFFALTHVDPSIVNTIHSGVGLLVATGLAVLGSRLAGPDRIGPWQKVCSIGVAISLAGLLWVVLSGRSGFVASSLGVQLACLAAVVVSGSSITVSLLYSKRLHTAGISSEGVTAIRYLLLIALAAVVEAMRSAPPAHLSFGNLGELIVATTLLMVLPLFALQVGIEHTPPVTAHVIRSLGPVFVFSLEQLDGRMRYSPAALACIVIYSAFSIASSLVELRRQDAGLKP